MALLYSFQASIMPSASPSNARLSGIFLRRSLRFSSDKTYLTKSSTFKSQFLNIMVVQLTFANEQALR